MTGLISRMPLSVKPPQPTEAPMLPCPPSYPYRPQAPTCRIYGTCGRDYLPAPMDQQIPLLRERLITAELFVRICQTRPRGTTLRTMYVWCGVCVGHLSGKPLTAHGLSKYLDLSRASVLRHLRLLHRQGWIERRNSHLYISERLFATRTLAVQRTIRLIREAADKLEA